MFRASAASAYATGIEIRVDGGVVWAASDLRIVRVIQRGLTGETNVGGTSTFSGRNRSGGDRDLSDLVGAEILCMAREQLLGRDA